MENFSLVLSYDQRVAIFKRCHFFHFSTQFLLKLRKNTLFFKIQEKNSQFLLFYYVLLYRSITFSKKRPHLQSQHIKQNHLIASISQQEIKIKKKKKNRYIDFMTILLIFENYSEICRLLSLKIYIEHFRHKPFEVYPF